MTYRNGHTHPSTPATFPPRPRSFADIFPDRSPLIANAIDRLTANLDWIRSRFQQQLADPRRNINRECGYPDQITAEMYQDAYDRDPIASRVVEVWPEECWQVEPLVYEDEDPNTQTPFEKALDDLGQSLRGRKSWHKSVDGSALWSYLQDVDTKSRICSYGVLLLGLDDGLPLSEPAAGVEEENSSTPAISSNGDFHPYKLTVNAAKTNGRKLIYLRALPQSMATITKRETNQTSPRYCQPTEYLVSLQDPTFLASDTMVGAPTGTMTVHWTRIVHIADGNVFHIPPLQQVFDDTKDGKKTRGAAAEGYWKNCQNKLILEAPPQIAGMVDIDVAGTKDQLEKFYNGLDPALFLDALTAKTLPPAVIDPTPHLNAQIRAICIKIGVPERIFLGAEEGKQAADQDQKRWKRRLGGRRTRHCSEHIIIPVIDRFIMVGVLPEPEQYTVSWPDLEALSGQEQANMSLAMTQALAAFAAIPPGKLSLLDFLTKYQGYSDDEAKAMIENADKEAEEKKQEAMKQQQEAIAKGLMADPTKPPPQPPGQPQPAAGGASHPDVTGGFGKKTAPANPFAGGAATANAFCATGEGGGVDPSCSSGGAGNVGGSKEGVSISVKESVNPSGRKVAIFHVAEDEKSHVRTFVRDEAVRIKSSFVSESNREKKWGVALYEAAIRYAGERGLRLESDEFVSADAVRVWKALERRGYPVVHHEATPDNSGGLNAVADKGPVFSILPRKTSTANAFCPTGEGGGIDPTCPPGAGQDRSTSNRNSFDETVRVQGKDMPLREFYAKVNGAVPERPDNPTFHNPFRLHVESQLHALAGEHAEALYLPRSGLTQVAGPTSEHATVSPAPGGAVYVSAGSPDAPKGPDPRDTRSVLITRETSSEELDYRLRMALGLKVDREVQKKYVRQDAEARKTAIAAIRERRAARGKDNPTANLYDHSQPRHRTGRWTDGSSGGHDGPVAPPAVRERIVAILDDADEEVATSTAGPLVASVARGVAKVLTTDLEIAFHRYGSRGATAAYLVAHSVFSGNGGGSVGAAAFNLASARVRHGIAGFLGCAGGEMAANEMTENAIADDGLAEFILSFMDDLAEAANLPHPDVTVENVKGMIGEAMAGEVTENANCGIAKGGFQSGNKCATGGGGTSSDTSHPDDPKSSHGASVISRVKNKIAEKYAALEQRYGRAGALAVMAGMTAMAPVPVPGAVFVPVGIAEGVLAAKKAVKKVTGNEEVDHLPSLNEGSNCGTGQGGFQPGNTCARGGASDPAANRPSAPDERHVDEHGNPASPAATEWRDPPAKLGKKGVGQITRPVGDESQTKVGDLGESLATRLGFRNILPEGKRSFTAKEVAEKGSSIDLEFDHSGKLYELKLCNTTSTEYRLKAKKEEKEAKERFANSVGAKAYTMVGVRDAASREIHFYASKEPGLTGAEVNPKAFDYLGKAAY